MKSHIGYLCIAISISLFTLMWINFKPLTQVEILYKTIFDTSFAIGISTVVKLVKNRRTYENF